MNNLRNSVSLLGHAGKAPELTLLESGQQVAKVSMATNESYKNKAGEKVTDTQWHNLVAWGKKAEALHNLVKKGSQISISGRIVYRLYEDGNGVKRTITEIVINEFLVVKHSSMATAENTEA